jgi:hypothetical protein
MPVMIDPERIREGISNPGRALHHLRARGDSYISALEAPIFSRFPYGENVLDEHWDVLVIFDTCRIDALRKVAKATNYNWLSEEQVGSRTSIGGSTFEWAAQTFRSGYEDKAKEIDLIAGNAVVEEVLEGNRTPEEAEGVGWAPTDWNVLSKTELNDIVSVSGLRTVTGPAEGHEDRPHPSASLVTDLAIQHARENEPSRMIVHYIQPHYPFYSAVESGERDELVDWEVFPFSYLRNGEVSREEVWNRYLKELQTGLDSVDTLLRNIDAERVAITADHGEGFGERWFGVRGYKHRVGMLHPKVRNVPWLITTAEDTGEYTPETDFRETGESREEILESLGYL